MGGGGFYYDTSFLPKDNPFMEHTGYTKLSNKSETTNSFSSLHVNDYPVVCFYAFICGISILLPTLLL